MSAPPPVTTVPTAEELAVETKSMPYGWVVGWSRSRACRFYERKPTPTTKAFSQWHTPTQEQIDEAEKLRVQSSTHSSSSAVVPTVVKTIASSNLPEFTPWKPPTADVVKAEAEAVKAAADSLAASTAATKVVRSAAEMEIEEREKDVVEKTKKRRAGLGFDDDGDGQTNGEQDHQRRKISHSGAVRFVSAGGAEANTPAAHYEETAVASSPSSSNIELRTLPSDPSRIESASNPVPRAANPPVYASSMEALIAISRGITFVKTSWSDPAKYQEVLQTSKIAALNNVYCSKDLSLFDQYMSADLPLPPPPVRDLREEPPIVINSRRQRFNELDACLTTLVQEKGLKQQPSMAFLRWGFGQRSLQNPADQQVDPLLPMNAGIDSCLTFELMKEKLTRSDAHEICVRLSEKCRDQATALMKLKSKQPGFSPDSPATATATPTASKFDLLTPRESYLHSFKSTANNQPGRVQNYRAHDLNTFNQEEKEQYKIIYDFKGDSEYAIPLNHERFMKLKADYIRTTGPILAEIKEDQQFLKRLWTMCARYDTISGAGYQAALPEDSFMVLKKSWGVEYECYASPLNHCLENYGTAFYDTDRFFGSKGSFLDQRPLEGGFESNPPFLEEVMATNALHVLALMERAQKIDSPLCFVVIWPGWDDTPAYDILMTSRFMRKLIVFESNDHSYKEGLQHRVTNAVYRRSKAKSFVFWMQTDAAEKKWPCTPEKLTEFKKSFMARR